ncbi:MAG: hypothetical protein RL653_1778 [Pseudomonadota bacterium]|jgi:hypothetical protein
MKPVNLMKWIVAALFAAGALWPSPALAQVPPRFYWKTLSDTNAVPLIFNSISGNTNPFDPSHFVTAGAKIEATLALPGYARTFSLFDRAAMAALIVPVGRISGELQVAGTAFNQSTDGFGDPMIEFDINLVGPRAQQGLPDVLRHEPGFSVDLLADLAVPIGRYDNGQALNLGQNRWYGRVAAPMVLQLGPWVPGRRTTLEFLPAVWLFGTNDDYVGRTLKTDPMFQLDAHLTRDLTDRFWASLDVAWYVGGKSSIDGVAGTQLNNLGVGFTLGYAVNDNLNLTVGYKSTLFDDAPEDLRLSGFMVSLVYGWHPLIEGVRRLKSEE